MTFISGAIFESELMSGNKSPGRYSAWLAVDEIFHPQIFYGYPWIYPYP